jgi:hypothetical protein
MSATNRGLLLRAGLASGLVQATAGIVMYLTGAYFSAWSMAVSLAVLLVCIVAGTLWYEARLGTGRLTFAQAFAAGAAISVCTGVVYAVYNLITITLVYPNFLDEMARAQAAASVTQTFESLRPRLTVAMVAIPNLIRLSVLGSVLSAPVALAVAKRPMAARPQRA